ncbi:MAG: septum formation initiator family protein [Thermonemataceae bacterium]
MRFNPQNIQLPRFLRNFYFLFTFLFVVWMLFFDTNDFITQYKRRQKIEKLEQEKQYYIEAIERVKQEREELLTNPKLLEKFAREKYYMHRPQEDLYVIIEEE